MPPPSGLGSCFGEPPFPLPLSGGDEELYSPASCRTNTFDGTSDISPSFDKMDIHDMEKTIADSRFIAQHVRNKDSFENVSILAHFIKSVIKQQTNYLFDSLFLFFSGRGRLEVRGNGPGPFIPLDLHLGLRRRHRHHHLQRSISLRHHQAHRCTHFQGGEKEDGVAQNGAGGVVGDPPNQSPSKTQFAITMIITNIEIVMLCIDKSIILQC